MDRQFKSDLVWNYGSLVLLAISGVLINLIVAAVYGAKTLGFFNLYYAVYIVTAQFTTLGIHYSVQRHISILNNLNQKFSQIFNSGFVLGLVTCCTVTTTIYLITLLFPQYFNSADRLNILLVLAGVLFFSLNKILLAGLNGLRLMKLFAIGQGARYIFMISFVILCALFKINGHLLIGTFLIAEALLFLVLSAFYLKKQLIDSLHISQRWLQTHFQFGLKGFLTGVFIEINTRVDVLLLSLFVDHKAIGIYSFAAMLAEGLTQLLVVVRNNVNPLLAQYLSAHDIDSLSALVTKIRKYSYPSIITISLMMVLGYPLAIKIFSLEHAFLNGLPVLIILCIGVSCSAGVIPFDNILTQGGFPWQQTIQNCLIVLTNAVLNILLIPLWGIIGSAIATAFASYILNILYISMLTNKHLNLNLFTLKTNEGI